MTASEAEFALVGRDTTAVLLEWLIRTRQRPLPVVVAFGPGGAGKTKLSEHVEERWRNLAPVAFVSFDDAGSKTCRDVLTKAANDLQRYSNRQFGRLALPRFELASRILAAPRAGGTREREKRALRLVAGRPQMVNEAAATVAAGISWLTAIGAAMLALAAWIRLAFVAAPPGLRWLRTLILPETAKALSWYEKTAPRLDPELPQGCSAPIVLSRLWDSVWDAEERADARARLVADRLLVSAFLADIDEAYRGRGRYRKLNCVLLLDGADLLYPDEENRLTTASARRSGGGAPNVLELLAEAKRRQPHVPLLVVATKQARPDLPGCFADADVVDDPADIDDSILRAQGIYQRWREANDTAYLPVLLAPFTATHTRQFLVEWSRQQERTGRRETLAEELHAVTRGHPLAVELVSDALANRTRLDRATPVVRGMLAEPVSAGEPGHGSARTVADLLVQRFLQRFPEDEHDGRRYHRRVLARLAAPRRLDLEMLVELMPKLDSELDARSTWRRLGTYSFMQADDDGCLVMHPLLRDLLCTQLRDGTAGAGPGYDETQRLFYEYYRRRATHSEAALHEVIYHALALGETGPATEAVLAWARLGEPDWPLLLEGLAEAPHPPPPLATARVEDERAIEPGGRRFTLSLPARWAVGAGASVSKPAGTELAPVDDAHRAAADLVAAVWRIRSCTGTDRWTVDTLDTIAQAYLAVGAGQPAVEARAAHYRRLVRADEAGASVDPPAPPPWALTRPRPEYPRIWLPRRAVSTVVAACVLVAAAGYATRYLTYWRAHCERPGYTVADRLRLPVIGRDHTVLPLMADGQCIGVTDAAGPFIDGEGTPDDAEVAELTRLVAAENADAVKQAKRRNVPYATVVVATMLSSVAEPNKRDLSAGINELRGAYLAQRRWNHIDEGFLGRRLPVRVLFANFGGNSQYAAQTAALIRARAEADPTIVGISGMGQTRRDTVRAAASLGTPSGRWAGLPMVGSAPSGDDFTDKPNFFRTAPPNKRQAEVGVRFLTNRFPDRHVWILSDADDLYSSGLAADYATLLSDARVAHDSRTYRQDESAAVDVFRPLVDEVCVAARREVHTPPLVVYTGRASAADTLLRDLQQGCRGKAVVLGGDDLSQLETAGYDGLDPKDYANDFLFFTTFGPTAAGWSAIRERAHADPTLPPFFADYDAARAQQRAHGGAAYTTAPNGHIMLAYDAVWVLLTAVEKKRGKDPHLVPTRAQVSEGLRETRYDGVAGVVDFSGTPGAPPPAGRDPAGKLVVVQQVARDGDGVVSRFVDADGDL